jgi:hypothetical protein
MKPKTRNPITFDGDRAIIHCIHFGQLYRVAISICDVELVKEHKWSIGEFRGYKFVQTSVWIAGVGQRTIRLGRFLLNAPFDKEVDHIDRDPLNFQRSNLRLISRSENRQNLSPDGMGMLRARGVSITHGRYLARVIIGGKLFRLGLFEDFSAARDAAIAFRAENMPFSVEALASTNPHAKEFRRK